MVERVFGVISQTLSNVLGYEKRVEAWHHRKSEENMLRQGRGKKVVQDLGRLAWHLYLMDLAVAGWTWPG